MNEMLNSMTVFAGAERGARHRELEGFEMKTGSVKRSAAGSARKVGRRAARKVVKDVWLVTETNAAGTEVRVVKHCATLARASREARFENGGYEGPVSPFLYPVGKVSPVDGATR